MDGGGERGHGGAPATRRPRRTEEKGHKSQGWTVNDLARAAQILKDCGLTGRFPPASLGGMDRVHGASMG